MRTSATQIETAALCLRKAKLTYFDKVPQVERHHFTFGATLHACCERFLKDQPLYPPGWDSKITPEESSLIVSLVNAGIEAGYLEKRPGGQTEQWFELPVEEEPGVTLVGKIDYESPGRIEDHKHSKNAHYLKSGNALKKSIQMLVYAKKHLRDVQKRGELPGIVTLAHNQFVKEPSPAVKRAEAEVTPQDVETFWQETVLPLIRELKRAQGVKDPFDLDDPPKSSCNAFGGCSYRTICSGQETVEVYTRRINYLNKKEPVVSVAPKDPKQFLAERAAAAASVNPPAPVIQAPVVPNPTLGEGRPLPPWCNPNCPACKSKKERRGFNSDGVPCRICMSTTKVSTEGYEWKTQPDGVVVWFKRGEAPVAEVAPPGVEDKGSKVAYSTDDLYDRLKACKTEDEVGELCGEAGEVCEGQDLDLFMAAAEKRMGILASMAIAKRINEAPPAPPEVPVVVPETPTAPAADAPKRGRPKGSPNKDTIGLVILHGCTALKGWPGKTVIFAEDLLRKVEGYWEDPRVFDRRGKLREDISKPDSEFVKGLADCVVVYTGRDPDVDNLISSLTPFAFVVQGVAR